MPYKTISFKLLRPTVTKQAILDDSLERYTKAFSTLLEDIRYDLPDHRLSRTECMQLLDRARMDKVNFLGVHPFKDSLKLDLSMLLTLWSSGQGAYPIAVSDDALIRRMLESERGLTGRKVASLFLKYGKVRPILFGRYDTGRDYSLLKNPQTGRYYVKLFLWSRRNAREVTDGENDSLQYLLPSGASFRQSAGQARYALFPIETGEWQEKHFAEIESGRALPKSALLLRQNGKYFLQIRLWYPTPTPTKARTSLGVARGVRHALCYCVTDFQGNSIESGTISSADSGKNRLHSLANQVIALAQKHQSRILLENLVGSGDDLEIPGFVPPLLSASYNQMADIVNYKASFAGLPPCVRVSARRIYQRCPSCGIAKKANRYNYDSILCVSCGSFSKVSQAAAQNLSTTLLRYQQTKIPVTYTAINGNILFYLGDLEISYTCPDNNFAAQSFCAHLQGYLDNEPANLTLRQKSIVKKLRSGAKLQDLLVFERS